MKKTFTLISGLLLVTSAYGEDLQILSMGMGTPGMDEPELYGLAMSANGRYVGGALTEGVGIFVADRDTGEVEFLIDGEDGGEIRGVDDNGVGIGFIDDGVLFDFATGEATTLPAPWEDVKYILGEGITNDGKMIVGSLVGTGIGTFAAYKKEGGEWITLPNAPREEMAWFDKVTDACAAKFVSGDGKVILGHIGSFLLPIVWTLNEAGGYDPDFFPYRFVKTEGEENNPDKPLWALSAMYLNLSNNGRYVSMLGLIHDENGQELNVPVIYDVENKTLKVYDQHQNIDPRGYGLYPSAVSDSGAFIGTIGQPYFNSTGTFIMRAGEEQATTYLDEFPTYREKLGEADDLGFNVPTSMSADGRYLLGYTYYCEDYYDANSHAYYITYIIDAGGLLSVDEISSENSVNARPEAYYSIDGHRLNAPSKGLNIIRMTDGSTRKVIVR